MVVENVERHLRRGLSPFDAAILGARELVGPIIAMTVSLAAVYIPIALQGGLTGTLFREFAFTLAGAVTISGVVALTLSPMMASKLLKPGIGERGVAVRPLDEALRYLEDEAAKILPKGYVIDYTGESRQLRTEANKFLPAFGLALVLIFLVLAAQFNSFRDPFVILAGSVPLAMFGALVFTFLKMPDPNIPFWTHGWTSTLNIYSQVGLVTLVGLVSKNGILIVEFANKLQEQGRSKHEAVREAALTRLRPILMTSVATIAGHFPLTLVTGAGAAARNSIGLVIVGGMTIGSLFTLFVVPSIYMLIARDHSTEETPEAIGSEGSQGAAIALSPE